MKTVGHTKIVIALILLLLADSSIHAQEVGAVSDSSETYNKVLNILFSLDELTALGNGLGLGFVTVLRYVPSFDAESQIVLSGSEGRVKVIEYKSLDGNIDQRLQEIIERTRLEDPAELAKKFWVGRREFYVTTAQARRWRNNLLKSISMALLTKQLEVGADTIDITVDGTAYEFWDTSTSGDIHYTPSANKASAYRHQYKGYKMFVRWMKAVQSEVNKRK